jgi:hypothetical protein
MIVVYLTLVERYLPGLQIDHCEKTDSDGMYP